MRFCELFFAGPSDNHPHSRRLALWQERLPAYSNHFHNIVNRPYGKLSVELLLCLVGSKVIVIFTVTGLNKGRFREERLAQCEWICANGAPFSGLLLGRRTPWGYFSHLFRRLNYFCLKDLGKNENWHHFYAHAQWWLPWRPKNAEKRHLAPSNLRPNGVKQSDSDLVETRMLSAEKALRWLEGSFLSNSRNF